MCEVNWQSAALWLTLSWKETRANNLGEVEFYFSMAFIFSLFSFIVSIITNSAHFYSDAFFFFFFLKKMNPCFFLPMINTTY